MKASTERVLNRVSAWALWILVPFAIVFIGGGVVGNIVTRGAVTAYLKSKGYA